MGHQLPWPINENSAPSATMSDMAAAAGRFPRLYHSAKSEEALADIRRRHTEREQRLDRRQIAAFWIAVMMLTLALYAGVLGWVVAKESAAAALHAEAING